MRGGIDIEAAAQPVDAKRIRVQTRLIEESKTFEEAARTAVVRIQYTCAQPGKDPAAHLSKYKVR